ncbi:MAG: hypothetical protein KDK53_13970, partial [Maritimibacter sp.]|nr:hypothetical protein [Maritimibacter sp.]
IHRLWYGLVPSAALSWGSGAPGREPVAETGLRIGRVCPLPPAPAPGPGRPGETGAQGVPGVQIIEIEPPFHIRLRNWGADGQGVIGAAGESEIFLVELGPQRLVLFAHAFSALPLGRALLAWLDDTPGRLLDRRLALIERRARLEDARSARGASPDALAAWEADAASDGDEAAAAPERNRNAS